MLIVIFRGVFTPFYWAIGAAYVLDMPAKRFAKWLSFVENPAARRATAVMLSLFLFFVSAALFGALLAPSIVKSAAALILKLPEYWDAFFTYIGSLPIPEHLLPDGGVSLGAKILEFTESAFGAVWRFLKDFGGSFASSVTDAFTAFILTLYMLFCKESVLREMRALVKALLPAELFKRVTSLFDLVNEVFSSYLSGRFLESSILGALCFSGLALSGIPYAPLLAIIVGVSNLIPFLGPIIGTVPCLLLLVVIEPVKALWFLIFTLTLQQLDNNMIYPKIVGTSVGLPAFWTVAGVFVGARIAGAGGAFLAVPCAAVIYRLVSQRVRA